MSGRKSDKWLTAKGLIQVEGWARQGLIEDDIAKNMGVSRQTLSVWKKKFPKFKAALERGKEVSDFTVESSLYRRALGFQYQEKKTILDKNGQEKRVEIYDKYAVPDTTAIMFWLRNRLERWSEQKETARDLDINISVDYGTDD